MVVDTESPVKHPDQEPGTDGEMVLCRLLEENAITLPPSPMTYEQAFDVVLALVVRVRDSRGV